MPLQPLSRESQALPAYQYFENVRNFLVAVEELKLPAFEASDLERVDHLLTYICINVYVNPTCIFTLYSMFYCLRMHWRQGRQPRLLIAF